MFVEEFDSPCGMISIVFDADNVLYHLDFPDQGDRQDRLTGKRFKGQSFNKGHSKEIKSYLLAYMAGDFTALDKISCDLGGTDFQNKVWQALKDIPIGKTCSYSELAIKIGNEKAVRAVARANALNPISLIYPCHRVIGADGSLTGYAGGLARKEWLLRHEGAL